MIHIYIYIYISIYLYTYIYMYICVCVCIDIGGAKVALPSAIYTVCHFDTTYMDCMTGEPPFLFYIFKEERTMKTCARFD